MKNYDPEMDAHYEFEDKGKNKMKTYNNFPLSSLIFFLLCLLLFLLVVWTVDSWSLMFYEDGSFIFSACIPFQPCFY